MGVGTVGLFSLDLGDEVVHGSEGGTWRVAEFADIHFGEGVESEDSARPRVLKDVFGDHQVRTALLPRRGPLFGGLENELHRPGQFIAHRSENRRDTHLHRSVDVVAACVHDPDLLVEVSRSHG